MKHQPKYPLVYKTVKEITLPAQLKCHTRIKAGSNQIEGLEAEFSAVRGQVKKMRLKVRGQVRIKGTTILDRGYFHVIRFNHKFGLELVLPEPLPAGHLTVRPEVKGITHMFSCSSWRTELTVNIAVLLTVSVKAAVPSHWAYYSFKPAFLQLIQARVSRSFYRERLLPLDSPGRKIIKAQIREREAKAILSEPILVSGRAEEEIIYWGQDGKLHEFNHTGTWSYLWPEAGCDYKGEPKVSVCGEIVSARLCPSGYTLALCIKETIELVISREEKKQVLISPPGTLAAETKTVRLQVPLAEQKFTELLTAEVCIPGQPEADSYVKPQAQLVQLRSHAGQGMVEVEGEVEVCLSYTDRAGRECFGHSMLPFKKSIAVEDSRPGQVVKAEGYIESICCSESQAGKLGLKVLCSGRLLLLAVQEAAVVVGGPLVGGRFRKAQISAEELIGRQYHNLLLEHRLKLPEQEATILDYGLNSKIDSIEKTQGALHCCGEVQLSLYLLTGGGKKYCLERSLPWRVTLNIAGTNPKSVSQVEARASMLQIVPDQAPGWVAVRVACIVNGSVYQAKVLEVAVGANELPNKLDERPVKSCVCEEIELEVIITPRSWRSDYETQVKAEIERIKWKGKDGLVKGLGEMFLTVTYAKAGAKLKVWQEKRPFELSLSSPAARPGQEIAGELTIKEIFYQTGLRAGLIEPAAPSGECLLAKLILAADLVLL
ncbi:MAG: hypothetical protein GX952_05415 [Firmicutes bacterium]|nr:hypothetical protein [Bacillota bacterium]